MAFLVLGGLAMVATLVLGVLWVAAGLLFWLVTLPFRLVGFAFKGVAALIALPFIVLFGILAAIGVGVGFLLFFVPLLPAIVLIWLVFWLTRRRIATA